MKSLTIDDIYNVVKRTYKNKSFTLRDAIDKAAEAKKVKPEEIVEQYGALYSELSQDPRFKLVEGKNWRLTEFLKHDVQQELTEKLYDEKDSQVYEEGFAPAKPVAPSESEVGEDEFDLEDEFEYYDEEDEADHVDKQKQLSESDDYDEGEEIEVDDLKEAKEK
ncbi:MAG: hypothetical protein HUJ52_00405 [Malacoplasma sp.]|nr:hypothetical protein [Malacoplasma sp.]